MLCIFSADYWKSSQAFALLGLFALGAAAVLSVLTLCLKDTGRRFVLILQTAALFGSSRYLITNSLIEYYFIMMVTNIIGISLAILFILNYTSRPFETT